MVDKAGGACRQLQSLQAGHTQMTIFVFTVSLRCWQMQYAHNKSLTLSLQEALWPEAQQSTPNHTIPFLLRYCFYVDLNGC